MQRYIINELGRTVYDDMCRMEAIVSASDLAWTLVRPSGLFETPAPSANGIAIDHIPIGSPPDHWVDCLLRQALDDTSMRSTIAVATRMPSRRC
jgi:hypothetical protein